VIAPNWKRDLVLVGGGHTHAMVLRMLAMKPISGVRLNLVSVGDHTPYSGMLPGLIAGHYQFDQTHIDLRRYCARLGVRFIKASACGIDLQGQQLELENHPPLSFDALSIDIGSQPSYSDIKGAEDLVVPVKPVAGFYDRWLAVEQRVRAAENETPFKVAIVGGGAGSVELAMAMRHRLPGLTVKISLICGNELLREYSQHTRDIVRTSCAQLGIEIMENQWVAEVERSEIRTRNGEKFSCDEIFWCTQAEGAPWLAQSGLDCDPAGFLQVRDTLQLLKHDNLFAAGDIATQINHPRPKAGVFAVRQTPFLAHNLRAHLQGEKLKEYIPQRGFLSMLSLGQQEAVAEKHPFHASGRWVWKWKKAIDTRFMKQFEDIPAEMPAAESSEAEMHCGGCGAKLPGENLRAVLADLSQQFPKVVDAGTLGDDASAIEVSGPATFLQSVDVLRQFVDDPWLMGRISLLHAISDLHAMGTRPTSVLSHVCLPYASRHLQMADLNAILAGACAELEREGATLIGGHTIEGPELSVGFTVNGLAANDILSKSNVKAGDRLILCKPLGTGVLFAAQQLGVARGDWISAALENMLLSNLGAALVAQDHGLGAATDVTGFGLLGHLAEMIAEAPLAARITVAAVPVLKGVSSCYEQGVSSSLQPGNKALVAPMIPGNQLLQSPECEVLFDPQTSGGLLLAVPPVLVDAVLGDLVEAGYQNAAVIGELEAAETGCFIFD
jgi:selenide, water dikinase